MQSRENTRLSHFDVGPKIRAGALGDVHRALDVTLERWVALKLIPAVPGDGKFERFLREARIVSALTHPHIARIFEIGVEDGIAFIAMELFEGRDLARVLQDEGPLEPERVRDIARNIVSGLLRAHTAGVIHRNLCPQNIQLLAHDEVKILDFGLAKPMADMAAEMLHIGAHEASLAGEAVVSGAAGYTSPEQMRASSLDGRSDLFSFGVIIYELLTGKRPYTGTTYAAVLHSLETQPAPSIDTVRAGLPRDLAGAVDRCIRPDADERFASAVELGRFLGIEAPLPSPSTPALTSRAARNRSKSRSPMSRGKSLAAAVVMGAAASLAVVFGVRAVFHAGRPPAAFAELPKVALDAKLQARFHHAVAAFYAGDDRAARAMFHSVEDTTHHPVLAVLLGLLGRESGQEDPAALCTRAAGQLRAEGRQGRTFVETACSLLTRRVGDSAEAEAAVASFSRWWPHAYFERLVLAELLVPFSSASASPSVASADAHLTELMQADPGVARPFLLHAEAALARGGLDEAERILGDGQTGNPSNRRIQAARARIEVQRGNHAGARDQLLKVLEGQPDDVAARAALVEALDALGDERGVSTQLRILTSGVLDPVAVSEALRRQTARFVGAGRIEDGERFIDAALEHHGRTGRVDETGRVLLDATWWDVLLHRPGKLRARTKRIVSLLTDPALGEQMGRRIAAEAAVLEVWLAIEDRSFASAETQLVKLASLDDGAFRPGLGRDRQLALLRADLLERRGDASGAALVLTQAAEGLEDTALLVELQRRIAKAARAGGDVQQAERALLALDEGRGRCDGLQPETAASCRISLVEALVSLAELKSAAGDRTAAGELLVHVESMWPKASRGLDVMVRARALKGELD